MRSTGLLVRQHDSKIDHQIRRRNAAAQQPSRPWVTDSIGLLGTEPSYKLMMECDTLLMIGSGFLYSEFLPKEGQAHASGNGHPVLASGGVHPR